MAAKKMSARKDAAMDKKAGIREGSARDNALDRKRGVPVKKAPSKTGRRSY